MIREVLRMGDARLLSKALPVADFNAPELPGLLTDMPHIIFEGNAGSVPLRVVIFGFEASARYPDAVPVPYSVLINPQVTPLADEMVDGWEGCLSVPGLRGVVPRCSRLRYSGYDASGAFFEREVDGFHARVVQHECDHLDGVLYPMRIRDFSRFGFVDVLQGGPTPEE